MSDTPAAAPVAKAGSAFALDVLSRDERFSVAAYQGFIAGLKQHWRGDLYDTVRHRAETHVAAGVDGIEAAMQQDRSYFLYSWLERRLQQFKYAGRWGLQTKAGEHAGELEALLPADRPVPSVLTELPTYVSAPDIHQHPGGIWGSVVNAIAHEWYQTGASFSGVRADLVVDHHVATLKAMVPEDGRILDVAATLGRTAIAIQRALPLAEVEGIDVAEPALRLARAKAERLGLPIRFRQASIEALPQADGSLDAVSAHWLFHELPRAAIERSLDEIRRVLKPGGALVICDTHRFPGGVLGEWLHVGHCLRNNEPYATGWSRFDIRGALQRRGFAEVTIWDLDPESGATDPVTEMPQHRTHYMTMITARRG